MKRLHSSTKECNADSVKCFIRGKPKFGRFCSSRAEIDTDSIDGAVHLTWRFQAPAKVGGSVHPDAEIHPESVEGFIRLARGEGSGETGGEASASASLAREGCYLERVRL